MDTEYVETLASDHKDWVSSLKCNRELEVHSFQLIDANGNAIGTILTHWCLVFVAYSILHLACLPPLPTNGKCPTYPIQTVGEVCRQQGQALIEELILFTHDRLEQERSAAQSVVDFSPTKS